MAVRKLSRGRSYAFDRALAKIMDLNTIAKKTGRGRAGILKAAGTPLADIARKLGRTQASVDTRAQ
jgi:hypothetical protein